MEAQVISKKRVADHGEVLTAKREVNAMLDLVKQEIDILPDNVRDCRQRLFDIFEAAYAGLFRKKASPPDGVER